MKRRTFLSSTIITGIGLTAASPAKALTINACDAESTDSTCRDVAQHDEVLVKLDALLAEKGLNEQERKVALAAARCPVCGNLLL